MGTSTSFYSIAVPRESIHRVDAVVEGRARQGSVDHQVPVAIDRRGRGFLGLVRPVAESLIKVTDWGGGPGPWSGVVFEHVRLAPRRVPARAGS